MAKVRNIESIRQKVLSPDFMTSRDIENVLMERGRLAALSLGMELLEQEVGLRCGRPFQRKNAELLYRGGSEASSVLIDGAKYPIRRPRIHNDEGEQEIETLRKLQDVDLFDGHIVDRMMKGVTTRNYDPVISAYATKLGVKKSSVSRAFKRASEAQLEEINHSSLKEHSFIGIVIDGVEFQGRTVIGALGITPTLEKIPLGIREGNTENSEVVKDLLSSIIERGFTLHCARLLAIIDGSKAFRKGLSDVFGDRLITQRCWIHKLRNLLKYAPDSHHRQIQWRLKKLMSIVNYAEALKELDSITQWLSTISIEAENSMKEVGGELLTLHQLGISGTLRRSLTTTNMIESLLSVVRRKTNRVTNWKKDKTQILRWVAASICSHRSRMRRVMGYRDGVKLIVALGGTLDLQVKTA